MLMSRRLYFLTSNLGKLREAKHHLASSGWSLEQFSIDGKVPELIEPQADSLEEVALSKLVQAIALLESQGRIQDCSSMHFRDFQGFIHLTSSSPWVVLGF